MKKVSEAKRILEAFGLPKSQQNDRSALTLLALSHLKENDKWENANAKSMSVVGNKDNLLIPVEKRPTCVRKIDPPKVN